MRFIIEGAEDYVSTVKTGMGTRADETAKLGFIIEAPPPNQRKVTATTKPIATGKDYRFNAYSLGRIMA